jgi:hypothetical protein
VITELVLIEGEAATAGFWRWATQGSPRRATRASCGEPEKHALALLVDRARARLQHSLLSIVKARGSAGFSSLAERKRLATSRLLHQNEDETKGKSRDDHDRPHATLARLA